MNLQLIAADLANRIPAMAQDCKENNEQLIFGLLNRHIEPDELRSQDWLDNAKHEAGYHRNVSFDIVWEEALKALKQSKQVRSEIKSALDLFPDAVRVCEGGGEENIFASFAVTLANLKMKHHKGCPAIEGKPVCTCGTSRHA